MNPAPGYVYLVRRDLKHTTLYKIGLTRNPRRRMRELDGTELVCGKRVLNPEHTERSLHDRYHRRRLPGSEWFHLMPEEVAECTALMVAAAQEAAEHRRQAAEEVRRRKAEQERQRQAEQERQRQAAAARPAPQAAPAPRFNGGRLIVAGAVALFLWGIGASCNYGSERLQEAQRIEAERIERLAEAERIEAERIKAERIKAERMEREAEAERLAEAERQAEAERSRKEHESRMAKLLEREREAQEARQRMVQAMAAQRQKREASPRRPMNRLGITFFPDESELEARRLREQRQRAEAQQAAEGALPGAFRRAVEWRP